MLVEVFKLSALRKWLKQEKVRSLTVETFQEIQRRRLIQANMLAATIAVFACLSEVFLSSADVAAVHLLIAVPMFLWYYVCHSLAMRGKHVRSLARIWMAIGAIALWIDVGISGGITGHAAGMMYLLPVGAALVLNVRDILAVSIANAVAIIMLAALDVFGPLSTGISMGLLLPQAGLMIINALCISATIIVITMHANRTDRALRNSLAQSLHMSQHDQLTGLLNRKWINDRLEALDSHHDTCKLYLVDLDGFKQVNDIHGHATGDALLGLVANRLVAVCPDGVSVARLGGDEFLILTSGDIEHDVDIGKRVVQAMAAPFCIEGLEVLISGSVGQASFPTDARSGEQLLARADVALYAAKTAGRNRHLQFESSLEEQQMIRNRILKRLRSAIGRDEIYLEYQPQFKLSDGSLLGFEALARWDDAELGSVSPNLFIPIAEEFGLIADLGERLLRRACSEAKHWVNLAKPDNDIRLSVNLSPLQLNRPDIVSVINDILEETGFPANRLELEITERVLIADPDLAQRTLQQLSGFGIGVALDDFGKGYSSLSYLQSLSLTQLKIDQTFIANIEQPEGAAFVKAIIQLADALNLPVIAEGVETEGQRDVLLAMNCAGAQGVLFSPSVAPQTLLKPLLTGCASLEACRSVGDGHSSAPRSNLVR